jgi:AmmeMemoRadiSam system protein A/AmmeMemoRadiSam system protein B
MIYLTTILAIYLNNGEYYLKRAIERRYSMPLLATFIVPHPPLIVPQVGNGQEKEIQKTIDAYHLVAKKIAELKPDTIIVTTPHSIMYSDYLHISPGTKARGSFSQFRAPEIQMEINYDTEFVKELVNLTKEHGIDAGTEGERNKELDHGTMVPLYFVNQYYSDYKLVRISISGLSPLTHYRFGELIKDITDSKESRYIFIASGDLSHRLKEDGPYGFSKEGVSFDKEVIEAIDKGDFSTFLNFKEEYCDMAAECGLRSFIIMAGALDGKSLNSELLSYEGPFGVGYGVGAFFPQGEDDSRHFGTMYEDKISKELSEIKKNEDPFVQLARQSLEYYIKNGKQIKRPNNLINELIDNKAGVFVSLKKEGKLRGCIGTIMPTTDCIADEIIQNAISAGVHDHRFNPIEETELPFLVYDVDVLGKSEPIHSLTELDVKKYGVIVSYKGKRGLLLPNLEGVDTVEKQIEIALQKANIAPNENYSMERFQVVRHL